MVQIGHVRPANRSEMVIDAAIELIRVRGYDAVGVDDIGAAAGVSGPAIYRHFSSKSAVLVAVFDRVLEGLITGAYAVKKKSDDPAVQLDGLVRFHSNFAVNNRALTVVYQSEERSLPPDEYRRLRHAQNTYVSEWEDCLCVIGYTAVDAHFAAATAIALINFLASTRREVSSTTLEETMIVLATRVLLCS